MDSNSLSRFSEYELLSVFFFFLINDNKTSGYAETTCVHLLMMTRRWYRTWCSVVTTNRQWSQRRHIGGILDEFTMKSQVTSWQYSHASSGSVTRNASRKFFTLRYSWLVTWNLIDSHYITCLASSWTLRSSINCYAEHRSKTIARDTGVVRIINALPPDRHHNLSIFRWPTVSCFSFV